MHLKRVDFVAEGAAFVHKIVGCLAAALALCDFLCDGVAARLDFLNALNCCASLAVESYGVINERAARLEHVPAREAIAKRIGIRAQQMQIVH
jgi:hypothetical protein